MKIHIVFDGPPSHESGRFVECETPEGTSLPSYAYEQIQWVERADGYWVLELDVNIKEPYNNDYPKCAGCGL